MSLAIVIPTYRPGPAAEDTWDDLRVCLASIAAYARGFEVVVAWEGPCPPDDLPRNPMQRILERPAGMTSGAACYWAAVEQTDATEFVTVSDDVVLMPDTLEKLLEDAAVLRTNGYRIGMLACRSNFAPGPQNIRAANGGSWNGTVTGYDSESTILRAGRVSPYCAIIPRDAALVMGPPQVEWYSDDIGCFDLRNAGFTTWISRAYVHHIGMRSSAAKSEHVPAAMQRLNEEALAWIRANRPDYWAYLHEPKSTVA